MVVATIAGCGGGSAHTEPPPELDRAGLLRECASHAASPARCVPFVDYVVATAIAKQCDSSTEEYIALGLARRQAGNDIPTEDFEAVFASCRRPSAPLPPTDQFFKPTTTTTTTTYRPPPPLFTDPPPTIPPLDTRPLDPVEPATPADASS